MKDSIISTLENIDRAKNLMEIYDLLNLKSTEDYKTLELEINKLVQSGIIHETKKHDYILMKFCSSLRSGKLTTNKSGNGFLIQPNADDIYIDRHNMNGAINNDIVVVDVFTYHGKKEGKVIRILDRNLNNIVGEITFRKNHLIFIPDDKKMGLEIELTRESTSQCVDGHKVYVEIVKKVNNRKYIGRVIKIIGHKNDPGTDILSVAYKHGFNPKFPDAVEEQLKSIPSEVDPSEYRGRHDLTGEMIFTIDGDDTKDIDDAISFKKHV